MALNKVFLIGNVGKDPDIRTTEQGVKVAKFPLATSEAYKDREGNLRLQTEWHNIVAWRNLAEICDKFVMKGTQIYIEGKIRTRSWEDKEGSKRYVTEIVADNIQMLGKRDSGQQVSVTEAVAHVAAMQQKNKATTPMVSSVALADESDDDLPF